MRLLRYMSRLSLKRRQTLQLGFSLVELTIAVAVLGLLTAIAIPVYGGVQSGARHHALEEQVKRAQEASIVSLESGKGPASIGTVIEGMNRQSELMSLTYSGSSKDDLCVMGKWNNTALNIASVQRGAGCDKTPAPTPTNTPVTTTPTTTTPSAGPVTPSQTPTPSLQLPIEGSGTATRGNLTVTAKNVDKWPQGYRLTLDAVMANNPRLADVWTVSWPDPLAKSANGNDGFNCVVSDGVVSCTTNGWLVNAFKWADRVDMSQLSIQIQSSDGYISPNKPKLSLK